MPRSTRDPLPSHVGYLLAMCAFATALLVLLLADLDGQFEVPRGVYAALSAAVCVTGVGYLVRSEGYHIRLLLIARLIRDPDSPEDANAPARGLDPEVIEAARSVARRLLRS